ncbi:3-isopropylmalate/(R)-2-methylmalate dehydratase large subunit [Pseudomonas cuatrocienegasensis]|uniref:3-isopropylmalate dehydratase n=1 Tax=Pseudomonas cuatrocienegasensis TaxID=543360 RepID=A0ABY1BMF5_9PSED|nr:MULTISPECIES: 3-isopropylmalate dehydratase large subunit [Pseudomonas]OEC34411.1 3-isopropylmalate dehydratase large subunit [Pseudomonas sp. 21C1]SER18833.1 3-isopropylmalate/(R)-2-methylmalate dehydratase large subunit [Pseudomonas cuatrocienegasensis]
MASTMFHKVFSRHLVEPQTADCPAVLYVDFHLLNEVTSPQAFAQLHARGLNVARPRQALAMIDHATPTLPASPDGQRAYVSVQAREQVEMLALNAARHGIDFLGWEDPRRGIVHVVGPELGYTLPGMTIVCGDSHTSTHGAFGALAFGIGTSEVAHVLATQCLLQTEAKTLRVNIEGSLRPGVTAKDLALTVITELGAAGGTGYVIEYAGEAVRNLTMEGRMTLCNMTIECGARAGMIAPDQVTLDWLRGRPALPADFEARVAGWLSLATDAGALFDREVQIDASTVAPMITWGTTPDTAISVQGVIPAHSGDSVHEQALQYMQLRPGQALLGIPIDVVFIGSCTNGRLVDLRAAAHILRGRKIAPTVTLLVVPGSQAVRAQAEAEGLDRIFIEAGGEWRLSGCSMCLGMNGDLVPPGQRVVSTSNRNFVGRQGPGSRTVLASPETAAACALMGAIADHREVHRHG